ncbi:MAG TPA: ABC transporter ATP-binding protein [Anaerolineales bacterium]|nr:ABC transporter ATP-binding protein [Anaerolineales bacterium]
MSKKSSDKKKDSDDKKSGSNSLTFSRLVGMIIRFSGNSRRNFFLAALMLVFEQVAATAVGWVAPGLVLDHVGRRLSEMRVNSAAIGITAEDVRVLAVITVALIVLTMLNSFCDSLAEIYLAQGGRKVGYNMRVFLYGHLQKLSLSFHSQSRTGDILTRVTSDVAAVENFIIGNLSDFVGSALALVVRMAAIFWIAWQVGVVALIIIPLMGLISNYFSNLIKTASKKLRSSEGDLASAAQEMLASIRVVQVYGQGDYEQSMFSGQSQKAMNAALEAATYQARFSWVISVFGAISTSAVIWVGTWLVFGRPFQMQVGDLSRFIVWIDEMFKPSKRLISEWNAFGKLYASLERINDLIELKPDVQDKPGAIAVESLSGQIEFRNVVFSYPSIESSKKKGDGKSRPTLNGLSFTIKPGQVIALVGHTGAGKSTVAQLIPRLYDPNEGQILMDGRDIRDYTLESLRAQMSMVLQESILFTGTIVENIAYGRPDATGIEIIEAAKDANADEFISKFEDGYYTILAERGANLSGGQRQRIAIARAFVRDTPILILDEPSTGLDAESTDLVLQALRKLMKGKTTIIISHELNLIREADQIIVIKEGQVEQIGTHDELIRAGGLYANLYIMQSGQRAMDNDATPVSEMAKPEVGKD